LRDKAIDCLGYIDYKVVEEIRILGAQSIGLSRSSKRIKELLEGKKEQAA
jgi:hypothetical protein